MANKEKSKYTTRFFNNYLFNAFDDNIQSRDKIDLFNYNYKRFFPTNKKSQILDIGIGRGEMLSCVKNWGYKNYLGIDISNSVINHCKNLGLNCELVNDTQEWLLKNKNRFNLITLLDVIEHIKKENLLSFLSSIKQSLSRNGVFIIQTPNLQSPESNLHRYNDFSHEFGYTEHTLEQVLGTVGFEKVEIYGFETIVKKNFTSILNKFLRRLYWFKTRIERKINNNLNPKTLNPVFFSVMHKS